MTAFHLTADFAPRGSQPDAIRKLAGGLSRGERLESAAPPQDGALTRLRVDEDDGAGRRAPRSRRAGAAVDAGRLQLAALLPARQIVGERRHQAHVRTQARQGDGR
ncbi:MAG TPA: hypothetical protein PKJ46_09715, partial [Methanoculleus sp.]|nr:hypothetical protein [Methanoculleus sp.]